jgi:hypothetical protein
MPDYMNCKANADFRAPCAALVFLGLFLLATAVAAPMEESNPSLGASGMKTEQVELRGKVVCIPELIHELYQTELLSEHEHLYGFRANDGALYTLLRTKYSDALFIDERLREKELLLKGRVFPKSHLFEPTRTRSIRNGVVYDLYYYCTVCSIETISAGPCACCQGPVDLMERPLRAPRSGHSPRSEHK